MFALLRSQAVFTRRANCLLPGIVLLWLAPFRDKLGFNWPFQKPSAKAEVTRKLNTRATRWPAFLKSRAETCRSSPATCAGSDAFKRKAVFVSDWLSLQSHEKKSPGYQVQPVLQHPCLRLSWLRHQPTAPGVIQCAAVKG